MARDPDVIVPTGTNPVVTVASRRNRTIPLVAFMLDPLQAGLVSSLQPPRRQPHWHHARCPNRDLGEAAGELLKEAIPSMTKAVFLGSRHAAGGSEGSGASPRDAAAKLGISLVFIFPQEGKPAEIERVFDAIAEQRPDAVLSSRGRNLYANRELIAELAVKKRLPTICPYRDYVEAGALMGYALDLSELFKRMADDVHNILKGAKPGDIPIYQATKFELLINQKTAKTFALTLPPALLGRADEVIE